LPVLSELKRRSVFKVAAAYAVVAWLLLQVADVLLPALQLPVWTITLVAVLLVLGFPIALVLSWAYDIGPGGVQRTEAAPAAGDQPRSPSRTIDFAIIGALSVALAFVVFNYVLVEGDAPPPVEPTAAGAAPAPVVAAPVTGEETPGVLRNSVAVLPLDNLSPNPDDAFFAAGMHEEILNHLAKLRNLSVISRTSVERYVDSELSLPEIARELNVGTVMEGSVRYAGDQVRVTLQLIDPKTDVHLWSESYDGDLSDVFAIQADIAMNVANALEAEFSLEEQQNIERLPTSNPVAYTLYLRALDAWGRRADPLPDLDRAIALDPDFALAYAQRAYFIAFTAPSTDETERRVTADARAALDRDPTLGIAHLALSVLHESSWRGTEALAELQRAIELSPNDPVALQAYAIFNRYVGNYSEAVPANRRAVALDPNVANRHAQLGTSLHAFGDFDGAADAFRAAIELAPSFINPHVQLAQLEGARGRVTAALGELELAEVLLTPDNATRRAQMAATYARIGRPNDARRLFDEMQVIDRENPQSDARWAIMYLAIGDNDEAYRRLSNAIENQVPQGLFSYADVRVPFTNIKSNVWNLDALEEPRFVALRERIFAFD